MEEHKLAAGKAISKSALLDRALAYMEEDTLITKAQGRDFIDSLTAAAEEALGKGESIKLLEMVKLTPVFKLGGKREVFKEFGNPESGKEIRNFPAKIKLTANALKPATAALPSTSSKPGKELKSIAEEKAAKAAQRRAEREKEAAKGTATPKATKAKGSSKKKAKK